MRLTTLIAAAAVVAAVIPASAKCRDGGCPSGKAASAKRAAPMKFEPHDPDRLRKGSGPGFVDVGGGTELRVGGRTRVEYGYTR